jgi:hypothetical protein
VLACVGANRKPVDCLDKLTHAQHVGYDARIAQWSDEYGGGSYGGVDYGAVAKRTTECADVTLDAGRYLPELDANAPERDWDIAARKHAIVTGCENFQWREETKECLADGDRPEDCLIDEPNHDTLEIELAKIDELAAKIATAKQKPASIDCKKVVAVWYADAKWKDKLVGVKDRAKQIAASRAAMQKACVADKWADTVRACVVLDGDDRCFEVANIVAWSFPAFSVAANAPPECIEYGASIHRLLACDKIPQAARDAMKQGFDTMIAGSSTLAPDAKAAMATACKAGNDAVVQTGKAACNW